MTGPGLWQSIAAALREDIRGGAYRSGGRLPTEAELALRFGVNRHTVRRALADLAEAGEVRPRKGAGVFVSKVRAEYALGQRVRFHQNVLASGRTPSRRLLRMETREATAQEAEMLGCAASIPVHLVEGISLADGEPVALFRSIFPAERFAGLLEALRDSGSVTEALKAEGVGDYTRALTRLTAEAADAISAGHLRLPVGAPVMRSEAVNHDPDGRVVEYGVTLFAGDRVVLTVQPDG